ncbi:hypothetical protein Tco_1175829 [Tanacetum coccineum]
MLSKVEEDGEVRVVTRVVYNLVAKLDDGDARVLARIQNVEHVLGDVLERLKVLESEENATSKKKLTEAEMKLELACMERDMVERRLHASYGWNKRFYMEMVRIGAVPKPPSDDEGIERPRKKSKKSSFDGTEGPFEMTEMFGLLKELTTSKAPEKVLIREDAKSLITKSVNSISFIKEEEEKTDMYDVAPDDDSKETDGPDMEVSVKEAETKNGAESGAKNKQIKNPKKEEVVEMPRSRPVEYYLKHRINEKLIEGIVDNKRFNDSLSGARAGKKKGKTYNVLPRGPVYEAILKK